MAKNSYIKSWAHQASDGCKNLFKNKQFGSVQNQSQNPVNSIVELHAPGIHYDSHDLVTFSSDETESSQVNHTDVQSPNDPLVSSILCEKSATCGYN